MASSSTRYGIAPLPPGPRKVSLVTGPAHVCPCHLGGMGWWDLMRKAHDDLMICVNCGDEWHRDRYALGRPAWTYKMRYVIQEQP